jgi:hypothetical protein
VAQTMRDFKVPGAAVAIGKQLVPNANAANGHSR